MAFYTLLKALLLPPGGIILCLIIGFLLVKGVLGRLFLFLGISLLTLMSLPVVSLLLMTPLEVHPALPLDGDALRQRADAILVLGAGRRAGAPEYGGDTLDAESLQRLRYAVRLARATGLPLFVTGCAGRDGETPVARLMADVLRDEYGLAPAGIETASRTTWENARFSLPLLQAQGVRRLLLVSDAWHLPRALESFAGLGLAVTPAPTGFHRYPGWHRDLTLESWLPSAKALRTSYLAVHEHLGGIWYRIRAEVRPAAGSVSGLPGINQ